MRPEQRPKCPTKRDEWGNCIPKNCEVWNDGCNTCSFKNNKLGTCTELKCIDARHTAKCERYSTNENDFFKCSKYLDEIVVWMRFAVRMKEPVSKVFLQSVHQNVLPL